MVSNQEDQVEKPVGDQKPQTPAVIPVDDPQAALRFCRWLAESLACANGFSGDGHGSSPSHPETGFQVDQPGASTCPVLSVVIPVCEEENNLPILYERLTRVLEENEPSYEIVFIDDGSRDGSILVLQDLVERDRRVTVVELARNFGHQVAISAGLDYARGQAVIMMDADLQDPPEVLPQFIDKWREGHEVVYAIRAHRQEGPLKRLAYAAFYRVLQKIADIEIPLDAGDFCIMDRRVVDILVNMPERNRFVRGIRSWVGLDQVGLTYERHARYSGKPKFTVSRLIYLALDGLVSFSYVPLRAITALGFSVSFVSIILAIGYTIQKLTRGLSPPGFATLVVAIFFLAGIQLVTLGVIGEYIGRIFEEVKQRPLYVVRKVTGQRRS
jgi:glycosyltransferase involved in cell wall biosynthesis